MNARRTGFTLMELMIALVVIGVLSAIAFPSYQEHVRRAKRTEGKTALLKAAQLQERIYITGDPGVANSLATYADNNRLPVLFGLAAGATVYSGENPALDTGAYTITVDANPNAGCATNFQQCFQLRATPNGSHSDPRCAQLTLTSTGVRGSNGTDTVARCWGM